jgi:hypothetical protein
METRIMATKRNNKKERVELYLMVLAGCILLAGVWAALVMPETALAKKPENPGKPGGGGGKFKTVLYDVHFSENLQLVFWSGNITGRIDDGDDPRMVVNAGEGGVNPPIQPKELKYGGFDFHSGPEGDGFDIAFPETTYRGTLIISADGSQVTLGFQALSRTGKKQWYTFSATVVETVPAAWDPLALEENGGTATLTLGAWDIRGMNGPLAKSAHAWGVFAGATTIAVTRK